VQQRSDVTNPPLIFLFEAEAKMTDDGELPTFDAKFLRHLPPTSPGAIQEFYSIIDRRIPDQ
jgi:hypothetical protein